MGNGIAIIAHPQITDGEIVVTQKAGSVEQNLIPANAQHRYEVQSKDLPLSCPMPAMYLWNSHPKVYLPVQETGEAMCPYCGAEYVLKDPGE
jgi:uncharacterized Zn-finger protein